MAIQMTCPYCNHEFPYDNGEMDRSIFLIGHRIHEIQMRLCSIKNLPPYLKTKAVRQEAKNLSYELQKNQKRICELKNIRKVADQQIHRYEYETFKQIFRETYGEEEYQRILEQVSKEIQVYKLSSLMGHEYTRSRGKNAAVNINKI